MRRQLARGTCRRTGAHAEGGNGLTTSTIARNANADPVRTLLRDLEAAGKARRTGQRRGPAGTPSLRKT
jgi:hypothetical protein